MDRKIEKQQERARLESQPRIPSPPQQAELDALRQKAKGGWLGWGWGTAEISTPPNKMGGTEGCCMLRQKARGGSGGRVGALGRG